MLQRHKDQEARDGESIGIEKASVEGTTDMYNGFCSYVLVPNRYAVKLLILNMSLESIEMALSAWFYGLRIEDAWGTKAGCQS